MPPAGWYPAPHANNEPRYWDGQVWAEDPSTRPTHALPQATQTLSASQPGSARPKGLAIAALVLGIVAFVTGLVPLLGLLLALGAIVVGILALKKKQSKGLAITGVALGGVALVTGFIAIVTLVFAGLIGSVGSASPTESDAPSAAASPSVTPTPRPTPTPTDIAVELVSVIDGDTIDTSAGKVRLIGIDAPEQGAWGQAEAAAALTAFLAFGPITLVSVPGRDDADQYGRLLRFVRLNGQDAGAHMIGTGWAIARYDSRDGYGIHPLETDYVALDAAHGMPAQPAPEPVPAPVQPEPAPAPMQPDPVPAPAQPAPAPETDPQFRTCGEANDNGYGDYQAGVDPEYNWYQDRDNDGWVCER